MVIQNENVSISDIYLEDSSVQIIDSDIESQDIPIATVINVKSEIIVDGVHFNNNTFCFNLRFIMLIIISIAIPLVPIIPYFS